MKNRLTGVMAIVMLLIVGLLAPASAVAGGLSCPEGEGWIKVDGIEGGSGTVSEDWGTLSWNDDTVSWDLEAGAELDLCIKSGEKSGADEPYTLLNLSGIDSVTTGPDIGGEKAQELSHLSYRVTYEPPVVEDDPELRLTSICSVTEDGTYLVYVNSVVGFEEMYVEAGDHVFRVVNIGTVSTTYYYAGTEMATLAPGEWDFFTVPTAQPGTTIITYGDGLMETKAQNTEMCDLVPVDDRYIVTFLKDWRDFDDAGITGLEFMVSVNGGTEQSVTINPPVGVQLPQGTLEVNDGDTVIVMDENITGLPGICTYEPDFPDLITVTSDTSLTVFNDVDCVAPEAFTITLAKEWYDVDGNLLAGTPNVTTWGIDLYTSDVVNEVVIDTVQASLPGDGTFEVTDGSPVRYGVSEDLPAGWTVGDCGVLSGTTFDEQGLRTTNSALVTEDTFHLVCNQAVRTTETIVRDRIIEREVIVEIPGETIVEEVIVEVEVLPEVIEAEPEAEPVVVAPEVVEVRGVTATRAVPTSIDTGTGGYLPSSTPTAALLLLMLGGLALTGGATASIVRRRG